MLHRHGPTTRARIEQRVSAALAEMPGLVAAWGFGSFFRGEPFRDLDVAVLLEPSVRSDPRFAGRLAAHLERLTGRPRLAVDLKLLDLAPVRFQHAVLRDGRLLCCRDDTTRVRFEAESLGRYLDYQPVLAFFDHAALDRLGEVSDGR